ncbi:sigma-70 family RNA polymerase sigma factor [Paludisphaera rhizosphaerae]|uniref:sigma-70 family RNA polymerase sigma factor n=1 Tax=Paludisphaera rhizosphaerae TaxID=2711216 RepID=UPI0013EB1EDB|nr:sigma-70 family RNA polymerase sigma factor [Paludisphaera rhizosphaerae]
MFRVGTLGAIPDGRLLDRFLSENEEAAEAAFEELVRRHGPMVFRVCRGVLRNPQDAEDAFQAAFLALATRAATIRQRESAGSWLFGVARRAALRLRRSAARRNSAHRAAAERSPRCYLPPPDDELGPEVLFEEIDALPGRLRESVILCCIEGLTYDAAADRLGLTEAAVRGRLARAREKLRRRLLRRGISVPIGLLLTALARPAEAVPLALLRSTTRISLGLATGSSIAALARGVLQSMMLHQLKNVAVASLALSAGLWALGALASTEKPHGQETPPAAPPQQAPRTKPAHPSYRMVGTVRVEGTGEPVAGATIQVFAGDSGPDHRGDLREAQSDAEGRYSIDLGKGYVRAWTIRAPAGYWAPDNGKNIEDVVLNEAQPEHRKDYVVRRAPTWHFQVLRPGQVEPRPEQMIAGQFLGTADPTGLLRVTVPDESKDVQVGVSKTPGGLPSVRAAAIERQDRGFRPDAVASIEKEEGDPVRFRLVDKDGKTASLVQAPSRCRLEPRIENGRVVVQILMLEPNAQDYGDLIGKVVDGSGGPIATARLALVWHDEQNGSSGMSDFTATTDDRGEFRLRSIPRRSPVGKSVKIGLVVTKDGFAGVDAPPFHFAPPTGETTQTAPTITLNPGTTFNGVVLDPEGKPVEGAWIEPGGSYAARSQFTKTDAAGRFAVKNLSEGMASLNIHYGKLLAGGKFPAFRDSAPITIKLAPAPDAAAMTARAEAAKAAREKYKSLAIGAQAPELNAGDWSDGRPRSLTELRGKIVFLNFWGAWCTPCVAELPTLEKLRAEYEPKGVVFLTIHTPGEPSKDAVRTLLEKNKATSLPFAFDRDLESLERQEDGATARLYGVHGFPTTIVIDRVGKVAFRTNDSDIRPRMEAIIKELGIDPQKADQQAFLRVGERLYRSAIEEALKSPSP